MGRGLVAAIIGAVTLASMGGCPGSLSDPGRFGLGTGGGTTSDCPDIPVLFTTSCALSGCHSAASSAGGLDLGSPDVFGRLSGKSATQDGLLIDVAMPASSVLYLKLMAPPPYGSRMPLGGKPLDAATIACVLTWIEDNGASPDGG